MFKLVKEIKSKSGELHFKRWSIIKTPWFAIYLHAIYKSDEDKHLHNHPWKFINIILKGSYIERMPNSKIIPKFPGMISKRTTSQFHKIDELLSPVVYTLNFAWDFRDDWGYMVNGRFIDHKRYREMKRNNLL